jgi:hypothetical protein
MNALVHPLDENPAHSNESLAAAAREALAAALDPPVEEVTGEETKKDKRKKKKKLKKAEEKARQALRSQIEAQHPRVDATPLTDLGHRIAAEPKITAGLPIQEWLGPVSRTLDNHRLLTANKASVMIGINCLMLAVGAHSLSRVFGSGSLGLVLIPLTLTNILSLAFAILSAQVHEKPTALDQLWQLPPDEYEPALTTMLQNRERVYGTLTGEVHQYGAALGRSRSRLRTAYNILLGGVVLSGLTFVICLALGSRP